MRLRKLAMALAAVNVLFSVQKDGLIKNLYPKLIGEYSFFKTVHDKKAQFPADFTEIYTVSITKKDMLITQVNGKGRSKVKYHFIETKMPFLEDENHVLYGRKNHYQAMFYCGDTIVIENFPVEYQENYFVKN